MEAVEKLPLAPGASIKQARLAAVLADKKNPPKTRREALERAGYAPITAMAAANRAFTSVGLELTTTVLQKRQLDSARGLKALGNRCLAKPELVEELDARDRLAFGLQCLKTAHELGDEPDAGSAAAFKAARKADRRRFAHLLDVMRAALAQYVVVAAETAPHNVVTETVEISLSADAVDVTDGNARFTYCPLSDAAPDSACPPIDASGATVLDVEPELAG